MALLRIILWLWQLPQNLLGLLLRLHYKGTKSKYKGVTFIVSPDMGGGLSLGSTVFVHYPYEMAWKTWWHEYGHTRQSLYLGPLYLLVIGIPSLIWADNWRRWSNDYYSFYTEKWADKLGDVWRG